MQSSYNDAIKHINQVGHRGLGVRLKTSFWNKVKTRSPILFALEVCFMTFITLRVRADGKTASFLEYPYNAENLEGWTVGRVSSPQMT